MKYLLPFLLFVLISSTSLGQRQLTEKYDDLLESTENYEQYKVIPRTQLNSFWTEVLDSLNQNRKRIQELRIASSEAKSAAERSQGELAEVRAKLDESLEMNDSISFLGIHFSKVAYHSIVWIIIAGLAVLTVSVYFMFTRSNSLTVRAKREYETLHAEYEAHKAKARETQVKLKRELQTAINQLNERRG